MAYTPTTWTDGDLITAEKMNKLEQGVQNEQVGPQGPAGATGATGATGPAGAAAGFGTPTATVDANTGTPSVTVSASGPDIAKVFSFAFKNLKGAKGDKGDKGDTGAQGPAGPKGDPGETGPQGQAGADGKYVTDIALTTTGGAVTGGTAIFNDGSTLHITVTTSEGDA